MTRLSRIAAAADAVLAAANANDGTLAGAMANLDDATHEPPVYSIPARLAIIAGTSLALWAAILWAVL